MAELKLGRLPDRTPVKLSLTLTPQLHTDLKRYAALYRDTYGEEESIADLIPAMLGSFLDTDRAFSRMARKEP